MKNKDNIFKLYIDALELAKKHKYKIYAFQRLDGGTIKREVTNLDLEIKETKEAGFIRTNGVIVDWRIIRNWGGRKVGNR